MSALSTTLTKQLQGIQHVGITVENMAQSIEFYTEVLGGKLIAEIPDIDGDAMQNTLLQKEELDALKENKPPESIFVPDLRTGKHKLDICLIKFDNLIIELLQYRSNNEKPKIAKPFGVRSPFSSPACINSMHISFFLKEDIDPDAYVEALEAECTRRGMTQVKCNRTIQVFSEEERRKSPKDTYTLKIPGDWDGWVMFYCKGPNGEQLEFNQLKGKAKDFFQNQ